MTRTVSLEVITNSNSSPLDGGAVELGRIDRDPGQWHQAVGVARQACARIFRDGGKPGDAIRAFGLSEASTPVADWSRAVALIAESLCTIYIKRAA